MDPTVLINERVDILTLYKKAGGPAKNCLPCKMRYQGRDITFTKMCFYHPTAKGKRMIHVFDVSDGITDYRLEFDAESLSWTLIAAIEKTGA
jgi:hypothetical protein